MALIKQWLIWPGIDTFVAEQVGSLIDAFCER